VLEEEQREEARLSRKKGMPKEAYLVIMRSLKKWR
jgi:hypothetical protein